MTSKDFFGLVASARSRTDALTKISETAREFAGAASAIQYDRAVTGRISNGYHDPDGLLVTVTALDAAALRALEAKERYLSLVSEAERIIVGMLADDNMPDVEPVVTLHQYYIEGLTQYAIAQHTHVSQAAVHKRLARGLELAQPYVDRLLGTC
jgi:hypothetical protein